MTNDSAGQALGQIITLAVSGSLFQNIGVRKLAPILPNASPRELLELAAGPRSSLFQSLSDELRKQAIEQIALSIRNAFAVLMAAAALGLISSFFLSVSVLNI